METKKSEKVIEFEPSEKSNDSQTVADIKVNWQAPIHPREQFLEDYHHCPLCSSELLFTHVTDFVAGSVKENAECLSCRIQVKSNPHKLH